MALTKKEVRALAERLMDDLGAAHVGRPLRDIGWSFGFDRARRRLGACHSARKRITLSLELSTTLEATEVEDTIRHEIAHALDVETRGRTSHDATWKAWAVRCGAAPTRCYIGKLSTDTSGLYAATCPTCGFATSLHRQPVRPLLCSACRKAKSKVFLRVVHRPSGHAIWQGGAEAGPYGGNAGYTATCSTCGNTSRVGRLPRGQHACSACCKRFADGRFDDRFVLRYVRGS